MVTLRRGTRGASFEVGESKRDTMVGVQLPLVSLELCGWNGSRMLLVCSKLRRWRNGCVVVEMYG